MGDHINAAGQFQSDRHPGLEPDKVVVSFKHRRARVALKMLAFAYRDIDPDFADDIEKRLRTIDIEQLRE